MNSAVIIWGQSKFNNPNSNAKANVTTQTPLALSQPKTKIYAFIDCETDGNSVIHNNMIGLACVLCTEHKVLGKFRRCITPLDGRKPNETTSKFWSQFPELYNWYLKYGQAPKKCIVDFAKFIGTIREIHKGCDIIWASDRLGFETKFIDYYFSFFEVSNPLRFLSIDVMSFICGRLNISRDKVYAKIEEQKNGHAFWKVISNNHDCLQDCMNQAFLFLFYSGIDMDSYYHRQEQNIRSLHYFEIFKEEKLLNKFSNCEATF